ncbi:DUF5047 domain-containing protein [Micromonospora sp. NPDC050417]|uniref:DUF5047 domain-containing protein n=1 Tax=Micromonospora sp. NPDC050417 TaxID=3364280 RepID=UPI0037990462
MVTEARIVAPGQTGTNPAGMTIPILGGDVEINGSADIRSTLDLTTIGAHWPTRADDPLTPYGNELWARRGIRYGNGTTEWVSLGYHRIDTPEQPDAPRGSIQIAASDRMAGLIDGRLLAPRQFSATATFGDVVDELVTEVYPEAVIEWDDDTEDTPVGRALIAEEDRHGFLKELVTSAAKSWWWDHRGVLVIRTAPDPTQPVWTVDAGAGGVLVSLARRLTRKGVYNAVVATGEAADSLPPPRGIAVDDNPESPTYWSGPFGQVPRFYTSPFLTTNTQATSAARQLLRQYLGLPYAVDFTAIPNPALEPYDPISVRYPGRVETHVVDRLTVPLTAEDPLAASTREQPRVLTGGP